MTTYKEIIGKTIKVVDSDLTDAGAEGQIWYNTTTGTFRSVVPLSTWASGGALNTGRNQVVGVGTQTASIAFAGFELLVWLMLKNIMDQVGQKLVI